MVSRACCLCWIKLKTSGNVFEKRLIEAYIAENGKDPVTGEELTLDDLVELKSSRTVPPRPPTLTSIPSLLSVFQNEWDALALETYTLRQHLTQTRQELSRALYEHDAAVRVITRLSRERDEAREALSKIAINGGVSTNGDAMQVDGQGLSETLVAKVEATQQGYATSIRLWNSTVADEISQTFKDSQKACCTRGLGYFRNFPKLLSSEQIRPLVCWSSHSLLGSERRLSSLRG